MFELRFTWPLDDNNGLRADTGFLCSSLDAECVIPPVGTNEVTWISSSGDPAEEGGPERAPAHTYGDQREIEAIRRRYLRRDDRVSRPDWDLMIAERQQVLRDVFRAKGWDELRSRSVLEVGCGEGNVLAE